MTSLFPESEIPDKLHYKVSEVCELTDTQPYILKFWEQEFPQLAPEKNRTGQRLYARRDIELVRTIKRLLYEKEYTIPAVRRALEQQDGTSDTRDLPAAAPPASSVEGDEPARSRRGSMREDLSGLLFDHPQPDHPQPDRARTDRASRDRAPGVPAERANATTGSSEAAPANTDSVSRAVDRISEELSQLRSERDKFSAESETLRHRLAQARTAIRDLIVLIESRTQPLP